MTPADVVAAAKQDRPLVLTIGVMWGTDVVPWEGEMIAAALDVMASVERLRGALGITHPVTLHLLGDAVRAP